MKRWNMANGGILQRLLILLIAAVLLLGSATVFAVNGDEQDSSGEGSNSKVVRVAYVISENFQEGKEGERKYGYGYEYLQRISYYTGWKYEYVYGNFGECLDKLISGEIDLMGDISYTDDRKELIDYSSEAQGEESFYLFALSEQKKLDVNDLSTFENARIGVTDGEYTEYLLKKWCGENNINCDIVEYEDTAERVEDLKNGVIDAAIFAEGHVTEDFVPIVQIGASEYYFGVNKNRPDILADLNYAMRRIKTVNPFYNETLRVKYMSHTPAVVKKLTDEEKDWINSEPEINIGYLDNYMPYCGKNEETGELDGMLKNLLENISDEYGVNFNSISYNSYDELKNALMQDDVDAIFPFYGAYSVGEEEDVMVSNAVTKSTMIVYTGQDDVKEVEKIALTKADPFQMTYASIHYPQAQTVMYDHVSDCIKAVEKGEADFTIAESARMNESENLEHRKKIQKADLQNEFNISFAVRRGDTHLLAVLNKGILTTDDSFITNAIISHSQKNAKYTTMEFIHTHIIEVILVLIGIFAVIVIVIAAHYRSVLKSKQRIAEAYDQIRTARWEAAHDALTGLLNRASFTNACEKLKVSPRPMALLIIDVDKFKDVNDKYGHETGDRALMKIAKKLMAHFRDNDIIIRYAGDEFVVMMDNVTSEEEVMLAERIGKLNYDLQHPKDGLPKLSLSVGIAFSEKGYEDDMFKKADQALYQTKENGRCGYSVYR